MKLYVVFNASRTKFVGFDNRADANSAITGRSSRGSISSLAQYFYETYGEEEEGLRVEVIETP